jgi:hypothetical protein
MALDLPVGEATTLEEEVELAVLVAPDEGDDGLVDFDVPLLVSVEVAVPVPVAAEI